PLSIRSYSCSPVPRNVTAPEGLLRRDVTAWTATIINVYGPCYVVTAYSPKGVGPKLCRKLCRSPLSIRSYSCSPVPRNVTARGRMLRRDVTAWTAIIINVHGPCYVVTAYGPKGVGPKLCRKLCRS